MSLFFAKYRLVLLAVAFVAAFLTGMALMRTIKNTEIAELKAKHDREAAERKKAENAAILARIKNNERKAEQDKLNSARIAKEHKNEMDKVRAALAAERLRKPTWCGGSAEGTQANSADSGNGADTASRLLPPAVEADIQRLIKETERAAATGRACQEFVRSNGMAPD